jgi:hypothetical protein
VWNRSDNAARSLFIQVRTVLGIGLDLTLFVLAFHEGLLE